MRADATRPADSKSRALVAVLASALLASCTTSGPGLEMASPSYNNSGIASVMADVAQAGGDTGSATDAESGSAAADLTDGEALPEQVTQLADANPRIEAGQGAAATDQPKPDVEAATAAANGEDAGQSPAPQTAIATQPVKRGFLASLFTPPPAEKAPTSKTAFAPAQEPAASPVVEEAEEATKPLIDLSSKEQPVKLASFGGDALPGVRQTTNLFEITHKSGIEDNSDVDLYEGEDAAVVLASAAGLARLAPNGLLKARESVDTACLKPELVRLLKTVERHFGKRMVITSGYRSPAYNRKVRGAERSQHMYCAAADVQLPGVSKWEIAKLVRSLPGRGGVGTYCHTQSVHIDVGPERDWNWRCRGKS